MHFCGSRGDMRSALFITNDEGLMNRIQIMVHDEAAQFFYAYNVDDAVSIMEEHEIAAVFMPYGLDVLSGDEMLEIILDHNSKAQIILLFDDEDLLKVIHAHNTYHICRLISSSNMKLELLPEKINAAFDRYNKDDEIREFEKDYRIKEDKYKEALSDITALLNDRMNSYNAIRTFFLSLLNLDIAKKKNEAENEAINRYLSRIMQEYVALFLLQDVDKDTYLQNVISDCHDPEQHRFLQLSCKTDQLDCEQQTKCLFVIRTLSLFFTVFYERYRGKIETEEAENGLVLNVVFECILNSAFSGVIGEVLAMNEAFIRYFADKTAFGAKDRILQYKLIYRPKDE